MTRDDSHAEQVEDLRLTIYHSFTTTGEPQDATRSPSSWAPFRR